MHQTEFHKQHHILRILKFIFCDRNSFVDKDQQTVCCNSNFRNDACLQNLRAPDELVCLHGQNNLTIAFFNIEWLCFYSPQRSTQFVIVHVGSSLPQSPEPCHLLSLNHLEFSRLDIRPTNDWSKLLFIQYFQQKLPQLQPRLSRTGNEFHSYTKQKFETWGVAKPRRPHPLPVAKQGHCSETSMPMQPSQV